MKYYFKKSYFVLPLIFTCLVSLVVGVNLVQKQGLKKSEAASNTYYVSPSGSDSSPGTQSQPWKSMYHAARTLKAGETAIFGDGTYIETKMAIFANNGTASAPIIVKAKNKHQAKLIYQGTYAQDIYITKKYITVANFEITQASKGTTTSDQIIRIYPSGDHAKIIGNKLHNALEEGVKTYKVSDILVEGNEIYDFDHEGIDFTPAWDSIIRNNVLHDIHRVGIMLKNETRNVKVYNNYLYLESGSLDDAIGLGGQASPAIAADPNKYSAYDMLAYNNIVHSKNRGAINACFQIQGCKNCTFVNNTAVGCFYGLQTESGRLALADGGKPSDAMVVNPTFRNNIVYGSVKSATRFTDIQGTLTNDHNLFDTDPKFVSGSDFHLQSTSPAIDAGTNTGILTDFDGNSRPQGGGYDIGVYEYASGAPLIGDFDNDNDLDINDIALMLAVYTQLSVPVTSNNQIFDVDGNNQIDIADIAIVLSNYTSLVVYK